METPVKAEVIHGKGPAVTSEMKCCYFACIHPHEETIQSIINYINCCGVVEEPGRKPAIYTSHKRRHFFDPGCAHLNKMLEHNLHTADAIFFDRLMTP